MRIYLVGFMGAGKSTLGKRLASRLKFRFIDADQAIVEQEGKSISQIFSDEGEEGFRQIETNWLKNFQEGDFVISLGGGTPCFNDNMELIRSSGTVIYAKVPVPILVSRLQNAKEKRPLIEAVKNDSEALTNLVEKMLKERSTYYEKADISFRSDSVKAEDLDNLIENIKSY